MAPPKLHGRIIGLPELHGRIRMVWPKLRGRFRMVWPKLHGRFRKVWLKYGILYWDSICSHQICTVGVLWHTLSIMQEKHWKNLFEIECTIHTAHLVYNTKTQNQASKTYRPSLYWNCLEFLCSWKLIMLDKIRFEIKVLFFSLFFGHKGQSGVLA
jgi:hypothetical protein